MAAVCVYLVETSERCDLKKSAAEVLGAKAVASRTLSAASVDAVLIGKNVTSLSDQVAAALGAPSACSIADADALEHFNDRRATSRR